MQTVIPDVIVGSLLMVLGGLVSFMIFSYRRSDESRDKIIAAEAEARLPIHQRCPAHSDTTSCLKVLAERIENSFDNISKQIEELKYLVNKNFDEAWGRIRNLEHDTALLKDDKK